MERIEGGSEFKEQMGKRKSNEKKAEASKEWAQKAQINFTKDLSVMAIANSLLTEDGREILAFLRHKYSNYEKLMQQCDERFAPQEAKKVIRLRLTRMMAKNYTALRDGASRQWSKWYPGEELTF